MARARALSCVLLLGAASSLRAQRDAIQPEARMDLLGPPPAVWQVGVGATARLGYYARLTGIAAYAPQADPRFLGDRWRADVLARLLLDPFRQQRWALSIGGGLSIRRTTYLAAIVDLEGPPVGGLMPALQVGVSGGMRAGLVFRRAMRGRR